MLGVLILLALAPPNAAVPLLEASSGRPLAEFSSCFTKTQESSGRAWAYLPTEHGGSFTNAGANGALSSYWLQVRDAGATTHIRLFADAGATAYSPLVEAVAQCR